MEGSGTVGIMEARQAWHEVEGKVRTDEDWHGNAGEVRQGSEAKGNAGRVEVRQARRVRAGYGRVWKVPYWIDQVRQARSV